MVYPSGRIVDYARDSLGRVTGVITRADATSPVVTVAENITWQPFGALTGFDAGNSQATDFTYDQDGRVTGQTTDDGTTDVQDLTYGYDAASNVTAITDALDTARNQSFVYDSLHRLTQAAGAYGTIDYTLDDIGNRKSRKIGAVTETYSVDTASSRLDSVNDGTDIRALTWDAAGNLKTDDRGSAADLAFSYDEAGRLSEVTEAGATTGNALYNASGERAVMVTGGTVGHSIFDAGGGLAVTFSFHQIWLMKLKDQLRDVRPAARGGRALRPGPSENCRKTVVKLSKQRRNSIVNRS